MAGATEHCDGEDIDANAEMIDSTEHSDGEDVDADADMAGAAEPADGAKYTGGRDEQGRYHDFGRLINPDGSVYTGQFQHGLTHGKGKLEIEGAEGRTYIGEFENDKPHGFCTVIWSDGYRIRAKFVEGRVQGLGVVEDCQDEWVMKGDLRMDNADVVLDGHGELVCKSGCSRRGLWRNDKLVKGEKEGPSEVIKGTFDGDEELHGYGYCAGGDRRCQGFFEQGKLTQRIYERMRCEAAGA